MADNQMIFALTLLVTFLLLTILKPLAVTFNWVDRPNERKQHDGKIPLVGGLAMFLASSFVVLVTGSGNTSYHSLLTGAALIVAIGLYDDFRPAGVSTRFIAQVSAALLIVVDGWEVQSLGNIFSVGEVALGILSLPTTVIAVVGGINAMNMSDGLDGLAGGLAFISAAALAIMAVLSGHADTIGILFALLGALTCFLFFNARHPWRKRAEIFMGDAGSMFLGFVLSWFFIHYTQGSVPVMSPVTALWLFSIPLMDTLSVMLLRLRNGDSPFRADRRHLHHILLRAGYSPGQVVAMIILAALVLASVGVAGEYFQVPEGVRFLCFVLVMIIHYRIMHKAWQLAEWLKTQELGALQLKHLKNRLEKK